LDSGTSFLFKNYWTVKCCRAILSPELCNYLIKNMNAS
jgi:hypothetical protein